MTEHASLAAALAAVQAELPEVPKKRTAEVWSKDGRTLLYSYDYADLADVSSAILPVLGKHGLAFTSFPGPAGDGKFGLTYTLMHEGGAEVSGFYPIDPGGGMQLVGGRITYARRYCLCAVTGVAAEDDVDAREDGQGASTAQRKARPPAQPARAEQQQPQNTARRAARPPVDPEGLPPLPEGYESAGPMTSGASSSAAAPGSASPARTAGPSPSSASGSVTGPQLTRIWATLTGSFGFPNSDKDAARAACASIIGRELPSSKGMTISEASAVIDTLGCCEHVAFTRGGEPRQILDGILNDPRGVALVEFQRLGYAGAGVTDTAGAVLRIPPPASMESLTSGQAALLAARLAGCASKADVDALLADGERHGE